MLFMEYRNLRDNIYPEQFNERSEGILNWIKENREKEEWTKDPNAFEMTNVFLLGAKYAEEGVDINQETLKEMWKIRSQDFARCGVSENNFVYKICEDSYQASQEGRALVNDEASHHALRRMAGIGLFLNTQKVRDGKVEYNNPDELLELLEASRTLKGVHPDLFEKYGFEENLQVIAKLQLEKENSLESRIGKAMDAVFGEQTTERKSEDKVKERE